MSEHTGVDFSVGHWSGANLLALIIAWTLWEIEKAQCDTNAHIAVYSPRTFYEVMVSRLHDV